MVLGGVSIKLWEMGGFNGRGVGVGRGCGVGGRRLSCRMASPPSAFPEPQSPWEGKLVHSK